MKKGPELLIKTYTKSFNKIGESSNVNKSIHTILFDATLRKYWWKILLSAVSNSNLSMFKTMNCMKITWYPRRNWFSIIFYGDLILYPVVVRFSIFQHKFWFYENLRKMSFCQINLIHIYFFIKKAFTIFDRECVSLI